MVMDPSILFDSIENGNMAKLEEYLMDMDPHTRLQSLTDDKKFTPLACAINFGQFPVLYRLHQFMAGNDQTIEQDTSDENLLQLAIKNSRTANGEKVLDFVLRQWGPKLAFIRDPQSGQTALHLAASRGLSKVFEILERSDTNALHEELVRSQDNTGQNPLHLSASNKHLNVVQVLLSIEPQLALQKDDNRKGDTALHKAVEAGDISVVRTILESSPQSIGVYNADNRNPYEVAKHKIELQLKGTASHKRASQSALDIESYLKEWILRHSHHDIEEIRRLLFSSKLPIFSTLQASSLTSIDQGTRVPVIPIFRDKEYVSKLAHI
jgi:ankyrin repeat protein